MPSKLADVNDKPVNLTDQKQFEELVERLQPRLMRFAKQGGYPGEKAEDIIQQTWEKALKQRERLTGLNMTERGLGNYLCQAINRAKIDEFRRQQRVIVESIEAHGTEAEPKGNLTATPEEQATSNEFIRLLVDANSRLYEGIEPEYIPIIQLRFLDERNSKEIGEILGLGSSLVRKYLRSARPQLQKNMAKYLT